MNPLNLNLGVANLGCGIALMVLVTPLLFGRARRGLLRGKHLTQQACRNIQQFWGKRFAAWALGLVALGVAAFFIPLSNEPMLAMAVAIAPLALLIPCLEAIQFSRCLANDKEAMWI